VVEIPVVEIEPIDIVTRENSAGKAPIWTEHTVADLPGFQGDDVKPWIRFGDEVGAPLKPVLLHETEQLCVIFLKESPETTPESKFLCDKVQSGVRLQRVPVPMTGAGEIRSLFYGIRGDIAQRGDVEFIERNKPSRRARVIAVHIIFKFLNIKPLDDFFRT
jgi:hypothetical protein